MVVNPGDPPPLICPKGNAIVDPRELGIAAGKKVKLTGKMTMADALHFTRSERSGGGTADGISLRQTWQPDGEAIIRLDGKPKVLKK